MRPGRWPDGPAGAGEQCLPGQSFLPGKWPWLVLLLLLLYPGMWRCLYSGRGQANHIVEVQKEGVLLAPFAAKFLKCVETACG
ncbi:MAG: hypothetical protein JW384_00041 [Nitrosomonadaceae bacterium]|nr:hypothetical protein [Nitrosomonadaceae bacterium]